MLESHKPESNATSSTWHALGQITTLPLPSVFLPVTCRYQLHVCPGLGRKWYTMCKSSLGLCMQVGHLQIIGKTPTSVLSPVPTLLILPSLPQSHLLSVSPHSCCPWLCLSIQSIPLHYVTGSLWLNSPDVLCSSGLSPLSSGNN